jgi:hypothetical protein
MVNWQTIMARKRTPVSVYSTFECTLYIADLHVELHLLGRHSSHRWHGNSLHLEFVVNNQYYAGYKGERDLIIFHSSGRIHPIEYFKFDMSMPSCPWCAVTFNGVIEVEFEQPVHPKAQFTIANLSEILSLPTPPVTKISWGKSNYRQSSCVEVRAFESHTILSKDHPEVRMANNKLDQLFKDNEFKDDE